MCLFLLRICLHICCMESVKVSMKLYQTVGILFIFLFLTWHWDNAQRNGHVSQAGEKRQNKLPQWISVIYFSLKYVNRMHNVSRGPARFKQAILTYTGDIT